jgi:predicted ester cyclase
MSVESTRAAVTKYIDSGHSDLSMMAADVVLKFMTSGDEHHGPDGVAKMLNYMYRIAFDAHPETRSLIIAEANAVYEADFVGRHIGEFAGIAPTGVEVRVPLCVVYDMEGGRIKRGRIYFEMPVLFAQIGQPPGT